MRRAVSSRFNSVLPSNVSSAAGAASRGYPDLAFGFSFKLKHGDI